MERENYAIELKGITKSFGSVVANNNISLAVRKGEILALLGENGSGKTTLMNMLSGIYKPDSGSIYIDGREAVINSPEDSKRFGIGMVHQHFKLIDVFSFADNIWIGTEGRNFELAKKLRAVRNDGKSAAWLSVLAKKAALVASYALFKLKSVFLPRERYKLIASMCQKLGFEIDSRKKVYNMSVSEKQTLEIIKVLYYGANVIILDEPTAVLTAQETEKLFSVLRRMKNEGHSVIIITHKLNEVMEISDRVAILRKGEYVGTVNTAETNIHELTYLMVGRKTDLNIERPEMKSSGPILEIRNLTVLNDEGATAINDVNFYIRGGEILGVAGIAGCGQKELCEAIAGLRHPEKGMMVHNGEDISRLTPEQIIAQGITMSFIPEDRLGMGLAPSLSITDNMLLKKYRGDGKSPFIDRRVGKADAEEAVSKLGIVTPSIDSPVRLLSGGNAQKVLVGREIMTGPNVIVTAYPVRGLDVGSSYAIYDILNEQKRRGVGILFVGEDLDVMLALCDKILVLCHGVLMGVVHAAKTDKEQLGLMMTGALDLSSAGGKPAGIAKDSKISK